MFGGWPGNRRGRSLLSCAEQAEPRPGSRWFAVRVRSNHEGVASDRIDARGIATYLPILEARSRRRDRRVVVRRPLFPGYFFVASTMEWAERVAILEAPGVVHVLGGAAGPIAVPDWQISSVRGALETMNPYEVLFHLVPGQRVRIADGALRGVEGVVLTGPDGASRLVISIDILGRSVAFRLDSAEVQPI